MFYPLTSRIMARTTLDIDASVLAQLRRRARAEHKSMGQLASERLAVSLGSEAPGDAHPPTWPTLHMGAPSVDLNDKDALWRVLDTGDASTVGEPPAS